MPMNRVRNRMSALRSERRARRTQNSDEKNFEFFEFFESKKKGLLIISTFQRLIFVIFNGNQNIRIKVIARPVVVSCEPENSYLFLYFSLSFLLFLIFHHHERYLYIIV